MREELLAKPEETLIGHTSRVCQMADVLTKMLPQDVQRMLRCTELDIDHWKKAVWLGAWLHDCGKANDHFQKMMRNPSFRQGVRHETLSLVLVHELDDWLKPVWSDLPQWAKCSVLFTASGHHLKFPDPLEDKRQGTKVTVYLAHKDFAGLLRLGSERFVELSEIPPLINKEYSLGPRGSLAKVLTSLQRELYFDFTDQEKALIATVKVTVMACDLAGSALPLKVADPAGWLIRSSRSGFKRGRLEKGRREPHWDIFATTFPGAGTRG